MHLPSPRAFLTLALLVAGPPAAFAEVERIEVHSRAVVAGGAAFGEAGPYEALRATLHYRFDPDHPANAAVVDLGLAPRDGSGFVHAHGDLFVLQAVDPERRSGTALVEVPNRGGKASLRYFQGGTSSAEPSEREHFGDGLLMRRGVTLVWVGWQFDVPEDPGRMRLHVPVATGEEGPLEGLVRADWVVDGYLKTLAVGHRDHVAYPAVDPDGDGHTLTVRDGRDAKRVVVDRETWAFSSNGRSDPRAVRLVPAFEDGKIYELVYRAKDPAVVGLGLAAMRDAVSWLKHDDDCPARVERVVGVGISQTGRFLRHFLYQGFQSDEAGRPAFDGVLIHTAGAGRGSFNHRFAQPSRDAHRYSAFFYPTDLFPFTGRTQRDGELEDGLFAKAVAAGHLPKVMITNTGYEYWGRAASLIHTSPDGERDVEPLEGVRLYHLAGTQHFPVGLPRSPSLETGESGVRAWKGNPVDLLAPMRAMLVNLLDWVDEDLEPPPSRVPTIAAGTLVPLDDHAFPGLPGFDAPGVVHVAYRADYGPRFRSEGIVDRQPPGLGAPFPLLVPQVDELGLERGGLAPTELRVPLATYTPWLVRRGYAGGDGELEDFFGAFVPLPRTEEEREATGDPRPSIEALYGSRETYLAEVTRVTGELVEARELLEEDVRRVTTAASELWSWIHRP